MASVGDKVIVHAGGESVSGILMPDEKDFVVVKLDTGYNIGIGKKRVKEIISTAKKSENMVVSVKVEINSNLPTISILHTGGTIASKVDYETGGVVARFSPEELVAMFPEIKSLANVNSRLVSNMWSQDMRFAHYNLLIKEIEKEIKKGVDGIIITHGTDTLHYTAAALSFAVQNSPVPIILVGSQRSSDRGSSDGALNLLSAVQFITQTSFAGVAVCMHESTDDDSCLILQGAKCRKMHASRRDAFQPVNVLPWARVIYGERRVEFLRADYARKGREKIPKVYLFREDLKIGIVKQHTNMFVEEFKCFEAFDGLVIETTGLGNLPTSEIDAFTKEHTKIFDVLKGLIKKMPVVLAPQTLYGSINLRVYENQRKLLDAGFLGDLSDMLPETSFIKLAWLLSNFDAAEVRKLFCKNFVGEISERIEPNAFMWRGK